MSDHQKTFEEGLYTVRILSDRGQGVVHGAEDLFYLLRESIEGDFISEIVMQFQRQVDKEHMAKLMVDAGVDPGFFQIGEDDELDTKEYLAFHAFEFLRDSNISEEKAHQLAQLLLDKLRERNNV